MKMGHKVPVKFKKRASTSLREEVHAFPLPRHVAVIMDGNGRWAKKKGISRSKGHEQGAMNIGSLLDAALELKIKVVSLYSFSTENWNRPRSEVDFLFRLLNRFITDKLDEFHIKGIKIMVSGQINALPTSTQKLIQKAVDKTKKNIKIIANFCLNYGSRDELCMAVNSLLRARLEASKHMNGRFAGYIASLVTREEIQEHLYTSKLPDVDLMVRTAGELRLSNFLLYQSAYAEFYFTDTLWPDFDTNELYRSIISYQSRVRKFGGLGGKANGAE